jgi:hypothetical protein
LHRDGCRNFGWRENDDARDKGFEKPAQMEAQGTVANQHGGAQSYAIAHEPLQALEDAPKRGCGHGRRALDTGLRVDLALELLLDDGIERKNFELAVIAKQRLHEGAAKRLPGSLDERYLRFVRAGGLEQSFQDCAEVAN